MPCHSAALAGDGADQPAGSGLGALGNDIDSPSMGGDWSEASGLGDPSDPGATSCSACAACHLASALLPGRWVSEPQDAVHGVHWPTMSRLPSHLPEGLERPPRASRT